MKNKGIYFAAAFLVSILLAACSTTQQTTKGTEQKTETAPKKDSLYIFDQVPPTPPAKDTTKVEAPQSNEPQSLGATFYLVQIGAFTTQDKADEFAQQSRTKIAEEIKISFNPAINLYVVQLANHYSSHDEAERVRNELWKLPEFKDAWIVTEQK